MYKKLIFTIIFFYCIYICTITAMAETKYINVEAYNNTQTNISSLYYNGITDNYIQALKIKYNDGTMLEYTIISGSTGVANNNGTALQGEGAYYDSEGNKITVDNLYYIGAQGYPAGANHTSLSAQFIGPAEGNKIKIYFNAPYHISNTGTANNTLIRSANGFYFGSDPTDIQQIYFANADILFYYGNTPQGTDKDVSATFDFEMMVDTTTGFISGNAKSDNFWSFLDPIWDFLKQITDFLAECWHTVENLFKSLFEPSDEVYNKLSTIHFPNYLGFVEDNLTTIDDTYDPKNTNYGTFYGADMNIDKLINSKSAVYGNKNALGGSSNQTSLEFIHRVVEFLYIFVLIILAINLTKKIATFGG